MTYDVTKPYKSAIREMVKTTWDNPYLKVVHDGYYIEYQERHSGRVIDHTDGLGTKGVLHWKSGTLLEAAQDALAMNVNDLAIAGATPYKAHVHLMVPKDDHRSIEEFMTHLCHMCCERKITITGGETAIHSNLTGMEISLNVSGVITEKWSRPLVAQNGDKLIGVPSSGPHSNGFTLLGTLFGDQIEPWMLKATRLYDQALLGKNLPIHAAMHITGGAWSKIRDILPNYATAMIDKWEVPECFQAIYGKYCEMYQKGMMNNVIHPAFAMFGTFNHPAFAMFSTFNMGIGLVLAVAEQDADAVAAAVGGSVIGKVGVSSTATSSFQKQVWLDTSYGKVNFR